MYAIVKTGGKQYRVEQGQSLLVERLPVDDGGTVSLQPLLYVDGSEVIDGEGLSGVSVQARVVAHEKGPKLRVVKFKPKRGYKRHNGHRQNLTRLEVTEIESRSSGGHGAGARPSGEAGSSWGAGPSGEAGPSSGAGPSGEAGSSSPKPVAADSPEVQDGA